MAAKRRKRTKAHRKSIAKLILAAKKHPNWKKLSASHKKMLIQFAKGE
jgi:hypothetical protein